jgi:hypothetical protein
MATPARKIRPLRTLGTNSAAPSATTTDLPHMTGIAGKAPKSTFVKPSGPARGHTNQNVRMKGAARNGNGTHFDMATVTAAATMANTTTHSHNIGSGRKKFPSARPMSPELKP